MKSWFYFSRLKADMPFWNSPFWIHFQRTDTPLEQITSDKLNLDTDFHRFPQIFGFFQSLNILVIRVHPCPPKRKFLYNLLFKKACPGEVRGRNPEGVFFSDPWLRGTGKKGDGRIIPKNRGRRPLPQAATPFF